MENDELQECVKLYKDRRFSETVDKLRQYLNMNPADIAARTYLGAALGQLNRYPEAAEEFLCLTRLEPGNTRHYYNLGQAYESLGSDLQAINTYEKALQIDPGHQKSEDRIKEIKEKQKNLSGTRDVAPPSPQPTVYEPPVPWTQPGVSSQPTVQPYGGSPTPQDNGQQQSYGATPPYKNNVPTGIGYNLQQQNIQYAMPDWLLVLLLLLLTPVGIVFMWWKSHWGSGTKWAVTAVLLVLCIVAYLGVRMETSNVLPPPAMRTTEQVAPAPPPATPTIPELKEAVEVIAQEEMRNSISGQNAIVTGSDLKPATETGYDYTAIVSILFNSTSDYPFHVRYLHKAGGDAYDWVGVKL